MEIVLADSSDFNEYSLDDFDRFQVVNNIYRLTDGELKLEFNPWTETWSPERRREKAREILSGDFVTYCAFEDGKVIGEIMTVPELDRGRLIVDSFHVDRRYRGLGIGRALLNRVRAEAKAKGASALYMSCMCAEETIGFYLSMGCRPSTDPIASYAEDEPWDIQMECTL